MSLNAVLGSNKNITSSIENTDSEEQALSTTMGVSRSLTATVADEDGAEVPEMAATLGAKQTVNADIGEKNCGLSAYEIWLGLGNTGSEQDFIDSLKCSGSGSGTQGPPGKSAYEIWLEQGNTGSEEDFLRSLQGSGTAYEIGKGLKLVDNTLSVDTAKDFSGDNTRPVEAAFMQSEIGNIEILLKTI